MKDESPNSLKTPTVQVARMAKWPIYAVAFLCVCLFGVLYYSVNYSHAPKKAEPEKKSVATEDGQKLLMPLAGHGGLTLPTPEKGEGPADGNKPAEKPIKVIVPDKESERTSKEFEKLRQQKNQAYMTALSSPLLAKRINAEAVSQNKTTGPTTAAFRQNPEIDEREAAQQTLAGLSRDPATGQNDYNPAADRDKEEFLKRSRQDEWLSPHTRDAGRPFEIKTGTVIPGVMISGINSDLPGNLIAQVSQNIYDTGTGHSLLIPQGSKLYGVYDSRVIYGQSRVLVAWNRVIFPDGSAVTLGAMPGADISGYAGFTDQVNNHYLRIFGSSMLMSLITAGTSYASDSVSNNNGNGTTGNQTTVQNSMAAALAAQLGQTTQALLQRNLNIKPTLEIRPGYQFNIVVTKDVVFKQPYKPQPGGGYYD